MELNIFRIFFFWAIGGIGTVIKNIWSMKNSLLYIASLVLYSNQFAFRWYVTISETSQTNRRRYLLLQARMKIVNWVINFVLGYVVAKGT